jgi:hypothetical protein
MSNFKYQYGKNGDVYLIIGENRIKVKWLSRLVPESEEINPAVEIIPSDILLCADNNFKQEIEIKTYPEDLPEHMTIDYDLTDPGLVDFLDGAEEPTLALVGESDSDNCQLFFGQWSDEEDKVIEPYAVANIKVKGFLFNQGLRTDIAWSGYKDFSISKVYPDNLPVGELEWSVSDTSLAELVIDPESPVRCRVEGKGKLGDCTLTLTYKADPSIKGKCLITFYEETY